MGARRAVASGGGERKKMKENQYAVIVAGAGNAALAAAVSARENGAECVVVLEKAPREMRGGNTHWSGGVLRFAFDDPREIGPLLPGVEDEMEDFYDGIQPYTFDDFHGDLMRVTSGQTDPVLSRILVQHSKDTVFWMNRVGNIRMEPATSLSGVRKRNKIIWARGLVVRAAHEVTDRSHRLSYPYGVMINRRGHRFVDEGEDGAMFTYAKYGRAILAEPGAKAYQIFDSQVVHLLEPRYATSEPITADTLEDLVAQLDIDDKAQAIRTLHEYNVAAKHAENGFNPTKKDGLATSGLALEKTNWATKLEKPPYYAYSATGGITFTFGGLRVDENAQVIGTDWRPITGLFACGEMIGGLFYDNYPAGTGLVSGATFGRIAGHAAAKIESNSRAIAGAVA